MQYLLSLGSLTAAAKLRRISKTFTELLKTENEVKPRLAFNFFSTILIQSHTKYIWR